MLRDDTDLIAIAREANSFFVIPGGIDRLLQPMSAVAASVASPYREIAAAFESNLRSVILAAGLPYVFALEASHRRRYQLLQCAAELDAVLTSSDIEPPHRVRAASADAQRRLRELSNSSTGRASLNREACSLLVRACDSADVLEAASQLLLQGTVLTWGALEVAVRDIFRSYLNRTPQAYGRLVSDAEVKKRFELTKISMDRVADLGFDLSSKLGELLAEQNDLADLGTIKVAVFALFPTDTRLRAAFDGRLLWFLFNQRHLIVHRRAVVDRRYLEATGDALQLGQRLVVTPQQLIRYIEAVVDAATSLVSAAAAA